MRIELPFPDSKLSGHNKGHWRTKSGLVKDCRALARVLAKGQPVDLPASGDIDLRIEFYPPDNRGDRVNYPNRMKPYIDGVADALEVNDKRFLPSYIFHPPQPEGKVVIAI